MRLVKLKGMRQVNGLHYAPDGRRLLAVGGAEVRSIDEARWVDVADGSETLRVPLNASCYAVSPDLTRMAVGNSRPYQDQGIPVAVFDPADSDWLDQDYGWQSVLPPPSTAVEVYGLAFAASGKRLAVTYSTADNRGHPRNFFLTIRSLGRGKSMEYRVGAGEFLAHSLAFAPNGRVVAADGGIVGDEESDDVLSVNVLDATSLATRHSFTLPTVQTSRLCYSPDGGTLAVANWKNVFLLPLDLSAPRHSLAHPRQVNAAAFTPDGRRVLTTCTDKLVRVWDAATGQLVTSYDWNVGATTAIAVAPDGTTAAVGGQRGQVVLFDLDG